MASYKSFEEVLKELDMDEEELKRLVSEGQIRAFRDEDRMKFRSEDVRSLRMMRTTNVMDEVDLGESDVDSEGLEIVEEETDETLLDLGNLSMDQDFEDTGATSVPTVELGDVGDDEDATLTEELVFDETDELGSLDFGDSEADATQKIDDLNLDDELGLETEPVDTGGLDELDDLDEVGDLQPAPAAFGGGMGMPGPVQIHEQVKYVEIIPDEGILWKVLTGITFLLVMFIMTTFAAMGIPGSDDVLTDGFGNTAHGLYLKGKNQDPSIQSRPYKDPAGKTISSPVTVSDKAGQIVWPGDQIIRSYEGFSYTSGSAGGGTGEE